MPGKKGFGDTRKTSSESPVYKKPSAGKYIPPAPVNPNTQGAATNVAAVPNVANTDPNQNPLTMKTGPFKMKGFSGFGNSPMTKKSPAKHDTDPHKEHDELTGTINDAGTRVIDESGKWTGVGDRPDLAPKSKIQKEQDAIKRSKEGYEKAKKTQE